MEKNTIFTKMAKDDYDFFISAISSYICDDDKNEEIEFYLGRAYNENLTPEENIEIVAALVTKSYISEYDEEIKKLKKEAADYLEKLTRAIEKNNSTQYEILLYEKLVNENTEKMLNCNKRFEYIKNIDEKYPYKKRA